MSVDREGERPAAPPAVLEALTSGLRRAVLAAPLRRLTAVLDESLEALGGPLALDSISLHLHDGDVVRATNVWCAAGVRADAWDDRTAADLGPALPRLRVGATVVAGRDDPDAPTRLLVPLRSLGELLGHLELCGRAVARLDDAGEAALLRLAEAIGTAWVRREARSSVGREQTRLEELLRHVDDVLLVLDPDGRCVWSSESVAKLGIRSDQLVGLQVLGLLLDDDMARVRCAVTRWHDDGMQGPLEIDDVQMVTPLGIRWISSTLRNLRHVPGIEGDLLTLHDVTERRHTLDTNRRTALTDSLTRLPNRAWLRAHLEEHLADPGPGVLGVLFLDLDHFKLVNDTRGHTIGDELLRQAAGRLLRLASGQQRVARFGGDEFVVVVREATDTAVQEAAERFGRALASPYFIDGTVAELTASLGLRLADPGAAEDVDVLLGDADTALFVAKERGRDRLVVFDPSMAAASARRSLVTNRLREAVEQRLVVPHFQPIVELATGRTVGVEALARWHDPELGTVSPVEFIPVAEETGLIRQLGLQMVESSAAAFAHWPTRMCVSVNVSARQLEDHHLHRSIETILRHVGLPADRLRLEVTESMLMRDPVRAAQVVADLRAIGLSIALDDFGTGHSSLAVLRDLPLDALKIDRSFVSTLTEDAGSRHVVATIVSMAENFGLQTVAEGVEEPEQAEVLHEIGCTYSQGWLHGRPMTLEGVAHHVGVPVPAVVPLRPRSEAAWVPHTAHDARPDTGPAAWDDGALPPQKASRGT